MHIRFSVLAACLAGALSAVVFSSGEKGAESAPLRIDFVPAGNLQVGVPHELLPEPIAVRTQPGAAVHFFSPDLGLIEESGAVEATVKADENGWARVHVRLGANLGRYTVIASPAVGDGSQALFTFRAIPVEAQQARKAKLAPAIESARASKGGGQ